MQARAYGSGWLPQNLVDVKRHAKTWPLLSSPVDKCIHVRRVFTAKVPAMPSSHSHLERSSGMKHKGMNNSHGWKKGMHTS